MWGGEARSQAGWTAWPPRRGAALLLVKGDTPVPPAKPLLPPGQDAARPLFGRPLALPPSPPPPGAGAQAGCLSCKMRRGPQFKDHTRS